MLEELLEDEYKISLRFPTLSLTKFLWCSRATEVLDLHPYSKTALLLSEVFKVGLLRLVSRSREDMKLQEDGEITDS